LAIHLADGSVRKSEPLPDIFSPSLAACQHSLTADGAWHAYVSVVDPSSISPHLVVGRLTFTWPDLHEFIVLLNVAVASLQLGTAIPYAASSAVSTTTLWYELSQGLVGIDPNNTTLGVTRMLPLPIDVTFNGLQYDRNGARPIVGVLRNATDTVLASFVDSGPATPVLVRDGLQTARLYLDFTTCFAHLPRGCVLTILLSYSLCMRTNHNCVFLRMIASGMGNHCTPTIGGKQRDMDRAYE
jgi:hypothetical protein